MTGDLTERAAKPGTLKERVAKMIDPAAWNGAASYVWELPAFKFRREDSILKAKQLIRLVLTEPVTETALYEGASAIRDFEHRGSRFARDIMVDDIHRHKATAAHNAITQARIKEEGLE